jgi:hypothetical protein
MTTITPTLVQYVPPTIDRISADAEVGRAFQRMWHERSEASRDQLRTSITALVRCLRDARATPDAAVLAFKNAIHRCGGVHSFPGLALEHNNDGDECSGAYAEAFTLFVDVYFSPEPCLQ